MSGAVVGVEDAIFRWGGGLVCGCGCGEVLMVIPEWMLCCCDFES